MIDFAIGVGFASAIWFGVTVGIAHRCARRNEALSRYIGALEVEQRRLRDMWNGLTGREEGYVGRHPLFLVRDDR